MKFLPKGALWALLLAACGGGQGGGAGSQVGGTDRPENGGETAEAGGDSHAEAPTPACNDEGCFPCGEGLCPKGFYCDQQAPGGPACSWLPECAAEPTCACLSKSLGSECSCSEKSSGVYCE
ncbi:MAG: hypothetical protein R3B13_13260 [Polyangiaceae bacterium]